MILSLGFNSFDYSKFESARNFSDYMFLNKPKGGFWGSTFTPDDDYASDWVRWTACEQFKFCKYGIVYNLTPSARIRRVDESDDYIKLLEEFGHVNEIYHGAERKVYIDWDKLSDQYDAVHISRNVIAEYRMMWGNKEYVDGNQVADLYSYDAESWIILNATAIDVDSVIQVKLTGEGKLKGKFKYPHIDRYDLQSCVELYKSLPSDRKLDYGDYIHFDDGTKVLKQDATIEQMIEYTSMYDHLITRKEFERKISSIRSLPNASSETIQLCNKLLGDKRCYDKIIYTCDGSYHTNRIWFNPHSGQLTFGVTLYHYMDESQRRKINKMSDMDQFKWALSHFDKIYFQCPRWCNTTVDFMMHVVEQRESDELDMYYDQMWSNIDDMPLHE